MAGVAPAMMKSWVGAMGVMEMEAASGTLQRTSLAQTDKEYVLSLSLKACVPSQEEMGVESSIWDIAKTAFAEESHLRIKKMHSSKHDCKELDGKA